MSSKTLISVNMITYGHETVISRAIKGVLMQRGDFDLELLIVDDCSPDDTENTVQSCLIEYKEQGILKDNFKVIYHRHKRNKGVAANFLWTLEACKGDYIAICEGDDEWTDENKIQTQLDLMNQEGAIMAFHDVEVVDLKHSYIHSKEYNFLPQRIEFKEAVKILPPTSSFLFKNIGFTNSFRKTILKARSCDKLLGMYILNQGFGAYVPKVMSKYHLQDSGSSKTSNRSLWILNHISSYAQLEEHVKDENKKWLIEQQMNFKKAIIRHHHYFLQALPIKVSLIRDYIRLKMLPDFALLKLLLRLKPEKASGPFKVYKHT